MTENIGLLESLITLMITENIWENVFGWIGINQWVCDVDVFDWEDKLVGILCRLLNCPYF